MRRILITGGSGLVGAALSASLQSSGDEVALLRHGPANGAPGLRWDPIAGQMPDPAPLESLDAVVNLAGEPIADGRWSAEKKQRIRESRVFGTQGLCRILAGLRRPPRVLISASAVGYYGDRGDELLTEDSPAGQGFLCDVAQQWEAATIAAEQAGIRVVNLRLGVVLSARGGVLAKLRGPFSAGMGGVIGDGSQYLSWISLMDVVYVIGFCLDHEDLRGPVNAVSPNPLTNREFTHAIGRWLHRPTFFPIPRFAVVALFGEMGKETLLASQRVQPAKLQAAGFEFEHAKIDAALATT